MQRHDTHNRSLELKLLFILAQCPENLNHRRCPRVRNTTRVGRDNRDWDQTRMPHQVIEIKQLEPQPVPATAMSNQSIHIAPFLVQTRK